MKSNQYFHRLTIKQILSVSGVMLSFAVPMNADAGSTNGSMGASATVNALCQTVSASTLAFGTYDPTSNSHNTSSTTISVSCTNGTSPTISFNAGSTNGATTAQRLLTNGTSTLNYNIYDSSSYLQELDATHTLSVTGTGLSNTVNVTAYGKIPKNQMDMTTGTYTDTVTVTVSY